MKADTEEKARKPKQMAPRKKSDKPADKPAARRSRYTEESRKKMKD